MLDFGTLQLLYLPEQSLGAAHLFMQLFVHEFSTAELFLEIVKLILQVAVLPLEEFNIISLVIHATFPGADIIHSVNLLLQSAHLRLVPVLSHCQMTLQFAKELLVVLLLIK